MRREEHLVRDLLVHRGDGGLKLKAVFECCKSGPVASAGNQRVNVDVTCAADTRGPLRDSVGPSR